MKKLVDSGITDVLFVVFLLVTCNVIKALPPYVKYPFSLNGRWKLESTTDRKNNIGATIKVSTTASNAVIINDQKTDKASAATVWKNINNTGNGFSIRALESRQGANYIPTTITVVSDDQIRLSAVTAEGLQLQQTWSRVIQ